MTGPEPVERDSRGILHPWLLRRRVAFARHPPTPALEGLVDRFWAVRWDLPPGTAHRQQVLTHPAVNVTVGTPDARSGRPGPEARVTGAALDLVDRELVGGGWTVAAMSTVGGMGAFVDVAVATLTDRVVGVDVLDHGAGAGLVAGVRTAGTGGSSDADREPARVAVLAAALERALDPARAARAREVAAVARIAETDRSVHRVDDLAARAGTGVRALQRAFAHCAGVSPTWVLRRYRLLEAAEAVRGGQRVVWSRVAAELGYADQAHLVRDFHAALGRTPEAYARSLR